MKPRNDNDGDYSSDYSNENENNSISVSVVKFKVRRCGREDRRFVVRVSKSCDEFGRAEAGRIEAR